MAAIACSQTWTHQRHNRADIKPAPPSLPNAPFLLVMLSVKVTGTILGAACQLTFIKQAIKEQITGLYGFIIQAAQDLSPGLGLWGGGETLGRTAWFSWRFVVPAAVTMSVFAQDRGALNPLQPRILLKSKAGQTAVKLLSAQVSSTVCAPLLFTTKINDNNLSPSSNLLLNPAHTRWCIRHVKGLETRRRGQMERASATVNLWPRQGWT